MFGTVNSLPLSNQRYETCLPPDGSAGLAGLSFRGAALIWWQSPCFSRAGRAVVLTVVVVVLRFNFWRAAAGCQALAIALSCRCQVDVKSPLYRERAEALKHRWRSDGGKFVKMTNNARGVQPVVRHCLRNNISWGRWRRARHELRGSQFRPPGVFAWLAS